MFVKGRIRWYFLEAYTVALLLLLWMPSTPGPNGVGYDKVAHALMFAGFSWLFWWCFHGDDWPRIGLAATVGLALGAVSELVQLAIPGRTGSIGDLAADAFGVLMGLSWAIFRALNTGRQRD